MTQSIFLLSNFLQPLSNYMYVILSLFQKFSSVSCPVFSEFLILNTFVLACFMLVAFAKCLVILFCMGQGHGGALSVIELHLSLLRELTSLGSFLSLFSWIYKLLVEKFSSPLSEVGKRDRVCKPGFQHSGNGNGKGGIQLVCQLSLKCLTIAAASLPPSHSV